MPWLEDLKFPRGYQMGTHIFQYTNFQMCKIYELWSLFLYHFEIYIMYDLYIYELRSFFCEKKKVFSHPLRFH